MKSPVALPLTTFAVPHEIVPQNGDTAEVRLEKARDYMRLFGRMHRRLGKLSQPLVNAEKVTHTQYLVLLWISNYPKNNQRELGDHLDLDANTISDVVRRLEARKLLTRVKSSSDRRVYSLEVTSRGKSLVKRIRTKIDKLSLHVLAIMPAEHRSAIAEWMAKVASLETIPGSGGDAASAG